MLAVGGVKVVSEVRIVVRVVCDSSAVLGSAVRVSVKVVSSRAVGVTD